MNISGQWLFGEADIHIRPMNIRLINFI